MRIPIPTVLVAAALLGIGTPNPAEAQNSTVDSRWIAYIGCWKLISPRQTLVCVVPAVDTGAVDLVTIENGAVVKAEQIIAGGRRLGTAHGECTGWQSAEWSTVSDRLYLHSEESCPGWGTRAGSGVLAMTREGQLLYIQGSTVGLQTGVHVERYREITDSLALPSEVQDALDALHLDLTAVSQARAMAKAPLGIDDLAEASRQVDLDVVEAWLVERGSSFNLDGKRLVALAKAGIPSRITDLMIALSYPGAFSIDATSHRGERRGDAVLAYGSGVGPMYPVSSWYGSCGMDYLPFPYSSNYCDGFAGYPYAYDYYQHDYPVIIIFNGSSGGSGGGAPSPSGSHGRVVNGRGYQEGQGTNANVARWGEPRSSSFTGSSSGAAPPPAPPPPATSSSSSGEQRTAKPRP
jgi:hypothetical protein